ncbi:MAG: ribonuclease III domain-containing protein [Patescibacteria group bacterium]|jgi:ribonuclease-3
MADIRQRSSFPTCDELSVLQERLQVTFSDPEWLRVALTHSSYKLIHPHDEPENTTLEYLGDAALELAVREYCEMNSAKFPGSSRKFKSGFVSNSHLAEVAEKFGIQEFVCAGPESSPNNEHVLADAMEAIIGIIFLEHGYEAVRTFVLQHILKPPEMSDVAAWRPGVAFSLEVSQEKCERDIRQRFEQPARYDFRKTVDHGDRTYYCDIYAGNHLVATGQGSFKLQAKRDAIQKAAVSL